MKLLIGKRTYYKTIDPNDPEGVQSFEIDELIFYVPNTSIDWENLWCISAYGHVYQSVTKAWADIKEIDN